MYIYSYYIYIHTLHIYIMYHHNGFVATHALVTTNIYIYIYIYTIQKCFR